MGSLPDCYQIPTECVPWPSEGLRRASVSSFGFGGSNSHVILDDAYHFLQARGYFGDHYTRHSSVANGSLNLIPLVETSKARSFILTSKFMLT